MRATLTYGAGDVRVQDVPDPVIKETFAVAMAVPRLTTRVGNAALLVTGIAVTAVGMGWLSTLEPSGTYLAGIALPMVLIGIGQGLAFAPLTSAGIAGVTARDAGAASGLVNTAHQLGSALGLGILVAVAASACSPRGGANQVLADHVSTALTGSAVLSSLALSVALAVVVPGELARRRAQGGI